MQMVAQLSPAMAKRVTRAKRISRWLDRLSALTPRHRTGRPPRRIGVLLQWGIGDAVTTLPLLGALHDMKAAGAERSRG